MTTALRRLVLWDVDGTLLRAGGVGGEAIATAVARVTGRPVEEVRLNEVPFAGGTDPGIVLDILRWLELTDDDAQRHLPGVLEAAVKALAETEALLRERGEVLPKVPELLGRLAERGDVLQTLLTGNLYENALLKLDAFGLRDFVDAEVGAYGSDHADRNELVPLALAKVEARHGRRFAADEVWVVGDTGRDLACARAAGVRCLLVGTGFVPYEELETLDADALVRDFSDLDAVERLLTT